MLNATGARSVARSAGRREHLSDGFPKMGLTVMSLVYPLVYSAPRIYPPKSVARAA